MKDIWQKIKNHEVGLKHTVRLYAKRERNIKGDKEKTINVWQCENCGKVFRIREQNEPFIQALREID